MSAEVYFVAKSGTPDSDVLGTAQGLDNSLHTLTYIGDSDEGTLAVAGALALVKSLPEQMLVNTQLVRKLEAMPLDETIRVSIDY
jgi:hypothetical protein